MSSGTSNCFLISETSRQLVYRQIGLGGNVTLDVITVPTEVILWRNTPAAMRTTCLDVYAGEADSSRNVA